MNNTNPYLIEPGVKYFLKETLKNCNNMKMKYYNNVVNIMLLIFLVAVITIILMYKYKGNVSYEEKNMREHNKQVYILEQIKKYQSMKQNTNNLSSAIVEKNRHYNELNNINADKVDNTSMITDLPKWDDDKINIIK
jgi:lipopolysaccharide/colanic/teichoic acid biosynthesis glycosyltransferase